MKAFVTGCLGQDGAMISRLLLSKNIDVYGLVRRTSTRSTWRIDDIKDKIKIVEGDLTDQGCLIRICGKLSQNML